MTDDVREALRDIIRGGSYSRFPGDLPYADVVDRILSDPRIEGRPRGFRCPGCGWSTWDREVEQHVCPVTRSKPNEREAE